MTMQDLYFEARRREQAAEAIGCQPATIAVLSALASVALAATVAQDTHRKARLEKRYATETPEWADDGFGPIHEKAA